MNSKTPVIDLSQCVGCEACLALCPDVFVISDTGYIEVEQMDDYPMDCVDEAINCCPTNCIQWKNQ